jgi:hypothetical protein
MLARHALEPLMRRRLLSRTRDVLNPELSGDGELAR